MSEESYFLHRDGLNRFLVQNTETGLIGLVFPGMPGESARAFSYDYGSVWYPRQIVNLQDFPELAEMPFFTIESCTTFNLEYYFQQTACQSIYPLLGTFAKFLGYSSNRFSTSLENEQYRWQYRFVNPNGSWTLPIFDIWVNEQGCWSSDRDGWVVGLNHHGELIQQYKLSAMTRCLTEGEDSPLVSCDDEFIYELSGKIPQQIYQVKSENRYYYLILALEKMNNYFLIADIYGQIICLNENLKFCWKNKRENIWLSYFLGSDHDHIYQGCYQGLICYEKTGKFLWQYPTNAPILCGLILEDSIILGCSDRQIYRFSTQRQATNHQMSVIFSCVGMPYFLTTNSEGKTIFISDSHGNIYCLDREGNPKETLHLTRGAAMAMQCWQDVLYTGTIEGVIVCFNLSKTDQESGHYANLVTSKRALPLQSTNPDITSIATENSVILECIKQGKKLKIRPLSQGYHTDWNVAFPHHLRMEGSRYQVSELKESKSGKFYRVIGEIKPL
jgi:outer membrane protein assembly factor BamB